MTIRLSLACFAITLFAQHAAAAAPARVPIDAFVDEDKYSQPRLSPDGKHIALNVRIARNGRMIPTMTVYSLPALQLVSTIALPAFEIPANFSWVTDRRLIIAKGLEVGLREKPVTTGELLAVDLDGTKQEYLYGYKGFRQSSAGQRNGDDYGYGVVNHVSRKRDGQVQVSSQLWDVERSSLYNINSSNAIRKLLADIPMKSMDFLSDMNDQPRFAFGTDDEAEAIVFRRDDASGQWKKLDPKTLGSRFQPFAFTPDSSAVLAYQSVDHGPYMVVREDLVTGQRKILAQDPLGSIDLLEYSMDRKMPFAVSTSVGIPKAVYIDAASPDAQLHQTLSASFPDAYVHFINFSDDGQTLLFSVSSDRDPGSYYLFHRSSGKADLLFSNMEQIDPAQMAERQPIRFKARDGLELTGFLTMPPGAAGKKAPMVLMPHGGPFDVQDDWFFDTDAQFLASRGYAVLQVNFRGSGGRSLRFETAGYHEFGGKIMDDLVDGVKWAAARPDIDAGRVCVYGASFGGYSALMLPVREASMFKCSVGYAGLYDLPRRYKQESVVGNKGATSYISKTMGTDPALLARHSPAQHAHKIKVPVLLVHGKKDKRTPIDQAETMRDALIRAGNAPEWIVVDTEGHGFYDAQHRKAFFEKLEGFLAKHIGN
jgi:dipeptidyl aminopeptidase/acylaminoacyl peptidase